MRKKIIIGICAVIFCAALVFSIILFVPDNNIGKSLNSKKYKTVQVKTVMKSTYTGTDESRSDQSEYNTLDDVEVVMQKDGSIIYESGISGKYYFYERDSIPYVLYYDMLLSTDVTGKWVEIPEEKYSIRPTFDFSCLDKISESDLKKENEVYVPTAESMEEMFFTLFNISNAGRDKYKIYDMKITFKNNRFDTITANYVFSETTVIEHTLSFSYDIFKLTLPAVDEVYTADKDY